MRATRAELLATAPPPRRLLALAHALALAAAPRAAASPLDPHLPGALDLGWSEGWLMRVTVPPEQSDAGAPASFGVVAGYSPRARMSAAGALDRGAAPPARPTPSRSPRSPTRRRN
jgi:hypothetical protein